MNSLQNKVATIHALKDIDLEIELFGIPDSQLFADIHRYVLTRPYESIVRDISGGIQIAIELDKLKCNFVLD
jgi:hypothetical protein